MSSNKKIPIKKIEIYLLNLLNKFVKYNKEGLNEKIVIKKKDAIAFIDLINNKYKINISYFNFVKNSTLNNLVLQVKEAIVGKVILKTDKSFSLIKKTSIKKHYKLSHAQKRMFVLYKLQPESSFYNMSYVREISGELNIGILQKAINRIIERHESFRTNFQEMGGEPVQIIKDSYQLKTTNYELNKIKDKTKKREKEKKIIEQEIKTPFNLETDALIRVAVIKHTKNKHTLIISMHHIISDGWSIGLFYKELFTIYNALLKNNKQTEFNLPKLDIQYKDYAEWEQSKANLQRLKKQERFWLKELKGELPVLNLLTDKSRPPIQTYNGSTENILLDKETAEKLNKLAKENNTTLFVLLFTIFNVFLHRITGQDDLIVGTPSTDRNYKEIENNIGLFVNTLAIRSKIKKDQTFNELLNITKNNFLKVLDNKDYPFEHLVEKINPERDMSRNPLFNVLFQIFQLKNRNRDKENTLKQNTFSGAKMKFRSSTENITKFDITMRAIETRNNEMILNCEYNTDLFEKETIERFLNIYLNLTKDVVKGQEIKIVELNITSKEERNKLIYKFNDTKADYPRNKTIHELFEAQVKRTPNNIAVEFENKKLTYKELNKRANQLAHFLRNEKKVKRNEVIGLMVERSFKMIIGILGIIKAGGVYLSIDPETPRKRIEYILKNSKAEFILSDDISRRSIESKVVDINDKKIKKEGETNLNNINKANDLIYVIYTSGSTGEPKGVMIEHQNVSNFIFGIKKEMKFTKNDKILFTNDITFDMSVFETLLPLVIGMNIFIQKKNKNKDYDLLGDIISKNNITILKMTPSKLRMIINYKNSKDNLKNVRKIIIGGEKLTEDILFRVRSISSAEIYDMYGPTETTVYSVFGKLNRKTEKIELSKLISNTQIYILNQDKKLQAIKVPGELYISGDGLARGYINDPKKTKEVFLPHPFIKNKRIYKTGDLAKMYQDGNIEILGRIDHQIKIRGYRIEPGEIEISIKKIDNIKDAIVIKHNDGLVAYYTTENTSIDLVRDKSKIDISKIKEKLKEELPEYMIPAIFMHLKEMPLNQNGKLDRKNLPKPTEKDLDKNKYIEPKTDTEKKIAKIWQEVLSVKKIGLNDHFFNLGGHSLRTIQVLVRINKIFSIDLSLRELFLYPVLCELANIINISLQKQNNNILKQCGGEPITEISEFFETNLDIFDNKKILIKCGNIQKDLFIDTIKEVQNNFKNILINYFSSNKKYLYSKNNLEKKEILIKLSKVEDRYNLDISYSNKNLSRKEVHKILAKLQYIYNLKLIDYDYEFIRKKDPEEKMYTPKVKNEGSYGCTYPLIYAKLKWLNPETIYYRSLMPALELCCVPRIFVKNNREITDQIPPSMDIGYENVLKTLKIDIEKKNFNNFKSAKKYFQEKGKLREPMILFGSAFYLFYTRFYHDNNHKNHNIPVLFFSGFKKEIIAHSAHLYFFGKIKTRDFWEYWEGYKYFEINNISKIIPHSHSLLEEALLRTLVEYFKNRTIKSTGKFVFKVYIGQQVFTFYQEMIQRSIDNKSASPDIVILDMIKRVERPAIFLRDLLTDLNLKDKNFTKSLINIEDIIEKWEKLFFDMSEITRKQNIFFESRVSSFPDKNLYKLKLFTISQKKYLLKKVKEIQIIYDNYMLELKKQVYKK